MSATCQNCQIKYLKKTDEGLSSFEPLPLPLKPTVMINGINTENATVFKSTTQPLGLRFTTTSKAKKKKNQENILRTWVKKISNEFFVERFYGYHESWGWFASRPIGYSIDHTHWQIIEKRKFGFEIDTL